MDEIVKLLKAETVAMEYLRGEIETPELNARLFDLGFHVTEPKDDWGYNQMTIAPIGDSFNEYTIAA